MWSATGRTTARAALTSSPAPIFDTLVVRCTNSLVERHPNRVVIRIRVPSVGPVAHLRRRLDQQGLTSASDPCRRGQDLEHVAFGPAPRIVAREDVDDQPREVVTDLLERRRGAVHTPILARATDIDGRRKLQIRRGIRPVQLPIHPKLWRNRRARLSPGTPCARRRRRRGPRGSSISISTAVPTTATPGLGEQLMRRGQGPAGREHIVHEQKPAVRRAMSS